MRRAVLFLSFVLVLFLPAVTRAQEPLTNESIIKLTKAGISESLIVGMVNTQPAQYKLGAEDVVELKKEGVSDKVVGAMLRRASGATIENSPTASNLTPEGYPSEIGVYFKKAGEWIELQPEVVNWKTGGVLKNIASMGVVKGDVNGHVEGRNSRNHGASSLEFIIVAPEGFAATEYQLLKLNQHSDNREFRTVTGGVFHAKGGSTRDLLPFEAHKIAPRYFSVTLIGLAKGEYGFLPPGGVTSAAMNSTLGKIYSFSVE